MRMLIVIILALAAATTIGLVSIDDPGLMVLSYGKHNVELPLVLALLFIAIAFAILYLLFNFLFSVLRAPKKAKKWNEQRHNKNAQNDTLRGYARLIEGDWAQGEKDLVKRLGHCKTPMLNYLGAAYAAQQQRNFSQRDSYLAQAEKIDPSNRMAIDITRARLLTQSGDFEAARTLLDVMHQHAPANKTILRLMADVFQQTHDWEAARGILPKLERNKALPKDQIIALDRAVRSAQLSQAVPDDDNPATVEQYKALPRQRKKDAGMAAIYARKLIEEGELAEAEGVVRKAISAQWNSELALLYGQTRIQNIRRQINLADGWLLEHGEDPAVHLTLARLNLAFEQHETARKFYAAAIDLGAGDEAYFEFGEFYENEGNHKTAMSYYKRGIKASIDGAGSPVGSTADAVMIDSVVTPGATDSGLGLAASQVPTAEQDNAPNSASKSTDGSATEVLGSTDIEDAKVIEHKA